MAATRDDAAPQALQRSRMRNGALGFTLFTVGGLAALFAFGSSSAGGSQLIGALRPTFLLLGVVSMLADVVLGAVRYQIFLRRIRPGIPLMLSIRADLAGRFLGAVTPSQSGGGPAQVFVLHRGGVPVGDSLSFLLVNLLCTLAFFQLAGGGAAWLFRSRFPQSGVRLLVDYGFVATLLLFGLMLLALVRPEIVAVPLERWARGVGGRSRPFSRMARLLADSLEHYRDACRRFVRDAPWLPALSFGVTIVMYLNKFGLAWLVARGLGAEPSFWWIVALQALVHFSVFLAPSPGGSGIAEVATGAFMSLLLPAPLLGPFTLVYRMLLVYLPAAAGAVILLAELARRPHVPLPPGESVDSPGSDDLLPDGIPAHLGVAPVGLEGHQQRDGLLERAVDVAARQLA